MPLEEKTKQIFLAIANARQVVKRFEDGMAGRDEMGKALSDLVTHCHPEEESRIGRKLEAEAVTDQIISEMKAKEIEAGKRLPELVEATNKLLPEHVSLEVREQDKASVNVMWKGYYAGTISTQDGLRWDIGLAYQELYFDSLRDAAVALTMPLVREARFLGYSQLGEHILSTRNYESPEALRGDVEKRLAEGWKVLEWRRDPHFIDYEWVIMLDPAHAKQHPLPHQSPEMAAIAGDIEKAKAWEAMLSKQAWQMVEGAFTAALRAGDQKTALRIIQTHPDTIERVFAMDRYRQSFMVQDKKE